VLPHALAHFTAVSSGAVSDDYRPREHDHLVEPVFGGLLGEPPPARRGLFARLWAWFRRVLRPTR